MKNEFGVTLDRNGYAPSILPIEEHKCYICSRLVMTPQRHEVYHGSDRTKSKNLGLWINVCPECHYLIHNSDGALDMILKRSAQDFAEAHYGWTHDDFRNRFRKSYN